MSFVRAARAVLTISIPLGLLSCHPANKPKSEIFQRASEGSVAELISTRPEKTGPIKLMVRLPADPLSKVSKEMKAEQLALVLSQQKDFTEKLQALSEEIKVVYTYKHILNAMYVVVPEGLGSQLDPLIPHGSQLELATNFQRPDAKVQAENNSFTGDISAHNSVKFIGADQLQNQGLKGQGMRVGVIDTGIDFTHAMLGGSGLVDDYKKINPSQKTEQFPNKKVVGGFDFVGTEYDSASANTLLRIPKPDANPLDESGHGSHVAGTIAGIGDGTHSYTGVAPEASLYALKVFGKDGSTDDSVVMAALEYAADPDQNIETNDALDVVNLSLGSPYGTPKLLYKEAIANLNTIGTLVVASAGNSGDTSYITGAPAVNEEALSVAASIDDMDQNWHFGAASFQIPNLEEILAETAEASFTKPIKSFEQIGGKLVYIGKAAQVSDEQAVLLKGNVALIDRGEIPFATKITNALKAGATAAVVINNAAGSPFTMGGGNETLEIPAVMIGLDPGKTIRDQVIKGATVSVNLKSDKKIAKPELIDTLTDFSSRGPRSEDSIIKPEISAPGSNIISAKVGGGAEVVQMSGTSMAAPHMAGVMALLKQSHHTLRAQELKSLAMLTSKSIKDAQGSTYPIALQGAGRIQTVLAKDAGLTVVPAAVSLGRIEVQSSKILVRTLTFKNLESSDLNLTLDPQLNAHLQLISPRTLTLKAQEQMTVDFQFKLKAPDAKGFDHELDGFILVKDQNQKVYSLPVLAMALKIANIKAESLKVHANTPADSTGSLVDLTLKNDSVHSGPAYVFQLLGQDGLKAEKGLRHRGLSTACDLESVGYRTVKVDIEGQKKEILQMALKLYNPLTTWNTCEFSVQIDADGDGVADQELAGASRENTEGLGKGMASLLLNAGKARHLRKDFENKVATHAENPVLDFSGAVDELMEVKAFNQSSLMIIQTSIASLKTVPGQNLRVKVGALNLEQDAVESDDFLGNDWTNMPLNAQAQTLTAIPESIEVSAKGTAIKSLTKGEGSAPIIIYYPFNHGAMTSAADLQSQILDFEYSAE